MGKLGRVLLCSIWKVSMVMVVGILLLPTAKEASADAFLNLPFGNNLQASCSYSNDGLGCLLDFNGAFTNINQAGQTFDIYGLIYGNQVTIPDTWKYSTSMNSDNSTNYFFSAINDQGWFNPFNPISIGISWNAEGQALNIGDLTANTTLKLGMTDNDNSYVNWGNAPDAITSDLEEFQNPDQPPIVPEPISSILFLIGAGMIGVRNYMRKK